MSNTSKLIAKPDLNLWGQILLRQMFLAMNCHAIGTLQSFDSVKQTAQVTLNYKRVVNGQLKDYPVMGDCPVVSLTGGGGGLTFPHVAGETCLVFFNDVNMDTWLTSGNTGAAPADNRMHSFSDGIVLVGLSSIPQALASYFTDGVRLYFGSTKIELTSKVKIANGTTDLKTVINGLIDALITLTGQIVPTTGMTSANIAANVAALTAYKTTVAGLLT